MPDARAASAKTRDAFLQAGEAVRWRGRPRARPLGLAPEERAPAILSLGWFGIASYALLWALGRDFSWVAAVAVAAVPTAFLALNARRLTARHLRRRARHYVLTDRRALWLDGPRVARALALAEVRAVSVHAHGPRTATVVLGPTNRAAEVLRRSSGPATAGRAALAPAFEGLDASAAAAAAALLGAVG